MPEGIGDKDGCGIDMINIIIFSKNRAAQLDLLLRSFKLNFLEYDHRETIISVIFSCSNNVYLKAYRRIFCEPCASCVRFYLDNASGSFKKTILSKMFDHNVFTMFLVDDIVFKSPFSLRDPEVESFKNHNEIIALSLRLWQGINYSYAATQPSPAPTFINGGTWEWPSAKGDWGYPMSVDGNIYKTDFIKEKILKIDFENPNELESKLASDPDKNKPYMSCYLDSSKLLNIPANRVQDGFPNKHGKILSTKKLNRCYLMGKRLHYDHIAKYNNHTAHVEIPLKWEPEQPFLIKHIFNKK